MRTNGLLRLVTLVAVLVAIAVPSSFASVAGLDPFWRFSFDTADKDPFDANNNTNTGSNTRNSDFKEFNFLPGDTNVTADTYTLCK